MPECRYYLVEYDVVRLVVRLTRADMALLSENAARLIACRALGG